jgi:transposase InsO family protein
MTAHSGTQGGPRRRSGPRRCCFEPNGIPDWAPWSSSSADPALGTACSSGPPGPCPGRQAADAPNRVWAVDFQYDATTEGRPVKIVSIVDEHTRECLGGLVDRSITGDDLIDELERLAAVRGYPAVLRCDNGPELACAAMGDWARARWAAFHPARRTLA